MWAIRPFAGEPLKIGGAEVEHIRRE